MYRLLHRPKQSLKPKTSDSYLNAIVSSSAKAGKATTTTTMSSCNGAADCGCYKCQRQRRRNGRTVAAVATVATETTGPGTAPTRPNSNNEPVQHAATTKRSLSLRKKPTVKSYDKHMPRPTYSENDSIYRINRPENEHRIDNATTQANAQQQADDYQISWKDDSTGDDLLGSLKAFQTIFAEQPEEENSGLSDLIERKAQELKMQKSIEAQKSSEPVEAASSPVNRRNGPPHRALTLYHTMKMQGPGERMAAYGM